MQHSLCDIYLIMLAETLKKTITKTTTTTAMIMILNIDNKMIMILNIDNKMQL